jgi:hypothetical protein
MSAKARRARARQKREGMIMLIVMLMLTMATGTALFTIQSTQYEQRASTAVLEANWARGIAECTTMAALAYAEDRAPGAAAPGPGALSLSSEWKANGSALAKYSQKYGFPEPSNPVDVPGRSGDETSSNVLDVFPPFAANAQVAGGLQGFLPGERRSDSLNYPMFSDQDDQLGTRGIAGLHYYSAHWLQEKLPVGAGANVVGGQTFTRHTRTVITGFAEMRVRNDQSDSSGVREIHELDAISRGYIDSTETF